MSDGGMCLKEVIKLLRAVFPSSCIVLALTIVSGLALFLPESTLTRLGINEGIQRCHPVITSVFWVLVTLWGLAIIGTLFKWIKAQINELVWDQRQWEELEHMDELPFALVAQLLMNENKELSLPQDAQVTHYLVDYGFIKPLHHFPNAYRNNGLCEILHGPSRWLLKAYQSGEYQKILAKRQAHFDKEKERTPGTTIT